MTRWSHWTTLCLLGWTLAASGCGRMPLSRMRLAMPSVQPTVVAGGDSRLEMARMSERLGRTDLARQFYRDALTNDPTSQLAHHRLGVLAAREQRWNEAAKHFEVAQKLGPPTVTLLNDIAYALYQRKQHRAAEETLREALDVEPENPKTRSLLALVLGEQGRHRESLDAFRQVVQGVESTPDGEGSYQDFSLAQRPDKPERSLHRTRSQLAAAGVHAPGVTPRAPIQEPRPTAHMLADHPGREEPAVVQRLPRVGPSRSRRQTHRECDSLVPRVASHDEVTPSPPEEPDESREEGFEPKVAQEASRPTSEEAATTEPPEEAKVAAVAQPASQPEPSAPEVSEQEPRENASAERSRAPLRITGGALRRSSEGSLTIKTAADAGDEQPETRTAEEAKASTPQRIALVEGTSRQGVPRRPKRVWRQATPVLAGTPREREPDEAVPSVVAEAKPEPVAEEASPEPIVASEPREEENAATRPSVEEATGSLQAQVEPAPTKPGETEEPALEEEPSPALAQRRKGILSQRGRTRAQKPLASVAPTGTTTLPPQPAEERSSAVTPFAAQQASFDEPTAPEADSPTSNSPAAEPSMQRSSSSEDPAARERFEACLNTPMFEQGQRQPHAWPLPPRE